MENEETIPTLIDATVKVPVTILTGYLGRISAPPAVLATPSSAGAQVRGKQRC